MFNYLFDVMMLIGVGGCIIFGLVLGTLSIWSLAKEWKDRR